MTTDAASPFDDAFVASLPRLEFAMRRFVAREGEGAGRVDRRGGRVEFADHRPYAPGDDPRFIDWPAYARTGKLHVKELERRDEYAVFVVVDDSGSMAVNGKLVAAQRVAYALAYLALAAGRRVRVALASDGTLRAAGEVGGRARMRDVAAFLVGARGRGGTRLTQSLARLPDDGRGARMLVVLSDLWATDDGRAALASSARRGDDVNVFHLFAAADVAWTDDVGVAEDAETGERRALGPGAADAAAIEAARREEDWRAFAAAHGIRYVPLDASKPTEELVLGALRDAGVFLR